ncbi:hypothetical protein [uncultured Clostridium sp.]|uniref:hypothetical protein n=1 Tax=uncultured Clostridium sp. TaxID=59620 RepID=UPI002622C847|nr:hypothetical protein [uncultured Clostridium sp.]
MISDYILIGILSSVGFVIWLIIKKILENPNKCCGDCVDYKNCWKSNNTCRENPACSHFKERYSDFNRD